MSKIFTKERIIWGALLLVALLGLFILGSTSNKWYDKYDTAVKNNKYYESQIDTLTDRCYVAEMTIDELEMSKDSVVKELLDTKDKLKIKDKEIKELGYIASEGGITDTIILPQDTVIIREYHSIDTTIGDEWINTRVRITYPSTMIVDTKIKSELNIVMSSKKEIIGTPSKVFFIRWFQKKHEIIEATATEKNPHIKLTKTKFVQVVD